MKKTLLILAVLLCNCFALKAQNFTYNNLNYHVTSTNPPTVELTGHTNGFTAHDLVIPSSVDYDGTSYSVTSICDNAFYQCSGLTGSLTIPNSVTSIGGSAFEMCSGFNGSLTIGSSVKSIGNYAFNNCSNFTGSLIIGNSVESIGDRAFAWCSGFNGSLTIGNSVKSIGNYAFDKCSNFTGSLTIPNSVTNIGEWAFAYCSGFNGTLTISNSVTIIRFMTFYGCSGFTGSLIIPSSVTSFGNYAFNNCSGFIYIISKPVTPPELGIDVFTNMTGLQSITVPCDGIEGYTLSTKWNSLATTLAIPIKGGSFNYDLAVTPSNPKLGTAVITQYSDCESSGLSIVTATSTGINRFTGWTENGVVVSTANSYTFELTSDRNLVANFAEYTYVYEPIMSIPSPINPDVTYVLGYQDGYDYYLHTSGTALEQMRLSKNPESPIKYCFIQVSSPIAFNYAFLKDLDNQNFLSITTEGVSLTSIDITSIIDFRNICITIQNGDISSLLASSSTDFIHTAYADLIANLIRVHTHSTENNLRLFELVPKPLYYITVSVNPLQTGTVMATYGGKSVESAAEGSEITVKATPADGYEFSGWTENGMEVSTDNPYTFTLTSDRNLVANFKRFYNITVSADPALAGSVEATCGNQSVESASEGSEITVKAMPAENYKFTGWTENGEVLSTDNQYTFILDSDRNLVAKFAECIYFYDEPIMSLPSPINPYAVYVLGYQDGDDYYLHTSGTAAGEMRLELNPTHPVKYRILTEQVTGGEAFVAAERICDNKVLKINQEGVSAETINPWGATDHYDISIVNGDITSAAASNYAVCHDGDIIKVQLNPSEDNLRFIKCTAKLLYHITVSANPTSSGSVVATCGNQSVESAVEGSEITVTATTAENYMFIGWTENGEKVSTDNPYTFTLESNRNLVANFTDQYDFTAICATGQILYYKIIDAEQHWVKIVAPNSDKFWDCYNGYARPTGNISLPETVSNNEISYTVKGIGACAFNRCNGLTGSLTIPNSVTSIGNDAFYECSGLTGSLTIGSSVESIGQSAFSNCNFDNIISKAQNAPSLASKIPDATSKVYIPAGRTESYESAWTGYSYNFIEYDGEFYHFNGTNGSEWNTAANWDEGETPAQHCPNVFINADCQVDAEVEVGLVTVAASKTLTVTEGKTLTADLITLENGAQLVNNGTVNSSSLTVKKDITGYGEGTGGWHLVSSPVGTIGIPSSMRANPKENYDLYRFEQSGDNNGNEWINAKFVEGHGVNFYLNNLNGYLYANKNATTILFRGGLSATNTKDLEYDADADFAGFNLVGNPYPCNATISGTGLRSSNYYYMMNADGTNLEVVENPVLALCTGVFAVAANSDVTPTVTFTQASATANVTRGEKSNLKDIRVELLANGKTIDRAFLNMNGESLPKFSLQNNTSEICFYQNKEELAVASTDATRSEMPLNFKAAKNGSYTISINTENVDAEYLHLIDNLTGNDVDLLGSEGDVARNVSTYTFDAKTSDYASRFKLVFSMTDTSTGSVSDSFAYISNGEIIISNEGRATLQVIDVLGRIVKNEEINGNCRISTNTLTAGLYILNLDGMTQKIVVE